eukprot:gene3125-3663_t
MVHPLIPLGVTIILLEDLCPAPSAIGVAETVKHLTLSDITGSGFGGSMESSRLWQKSRLFLDLSVTGRQRHRSSAVPASANPRWPAKSFTFSVKDLGEEELHVDVFRQQGGVEKATLLGMFSMRLSSLAHGYSETLSIPLMSRSHSTVDWCCPPMQLLAVVSLNQVELPSIGALVVQPQAVQNLPPTPSSPRAGMVVQTTTQNQKYQSSVIPATNQWTSCDIMLFDVKDISTSTLFLTVQSIVPRTNAKQCIGQYTLSLQSLTPGVTIECCLNLVVRPSGHKQWIESPHGTALTVLVHYAMNQDLDLAHLQRHGMPSSSVTSPPASQPSPLPAQTTPRTSMSHTLSPSSSLVTSVALAGASSPNNHHTVLDMPHPSAASATHATPIQITHADNIRVTNSTHLEYEDVSSSLTDSLRAWSPEQPSRPHQWTTSPGSAQASLSLSQQTVLLRNAMP